MPKLHNGEEVIFLPGHHGRPHLPAHVQMMVQAPSAGMTGRVLDTYHDAAQVRWDDGVTTVVHALDLAARSHHRAPMVHGNPSHAHETEDLVAPGDRVTYRPSRHGRPHLPSAMMVMVQPPRVVGMTGTALETFNDVAQVQWDDGTVTVVHQLDLGYSDFHGVQPGAMMHNNPSHWRHFQRPSTSRPLTRETPEEEALRCHLRALELDAEGSDLEADAYCNQRDLALREIPLSHRKKVIAALPPRKRNPPW
jgi:hypothetical protein